MHARLPPAVHPGARLHADACPRKLRARVLPPAGRHHDHQPGRSVLKRLRGRLAACHFHLPSSTMSRTSPCGWAREAFFLEEMLGPSKYAQAITALLLPFWFFVLFSFPALFLCMRAY